MNTKNELQDILKKLEQETGILFQVSSSSLDEVETLSKLNDLLAKCQSIENRNIFLKQFLLGQLTEEEINEKILRFHFVSDIPRVLLYIQCKEPYDASVTSVLSSIFLPGTNDLVEIDDTHIVLIHQVRNILSENELTELAYNVINTLSSEAMISAKISFAKPCEYFKELPLSYQNSAVAMEIGTIFYSQELIYNYLALGLGKLIYYLPKEICEGYLYEKLNGINLYDLDDEMLQTIHTFFESGLSIAECSRQLFLHRNTLCYRLEKFEKYTGLDLKNFDDAVTCKIAMMISDYLKTK